MTFPILNDQSNQAQAPTPSARGRRLLLLLWCVGAFTLLQLAACRGDRQDASGGATGAGDDVTKVAVTKLASDEQLILLPSSASQEAGQWVVPLTVWVFEPEEDSLLRRKTLHAIASALGLQSGVLDGEGQEAIFRSRASMFMVDNERNKKVTVSFGGGSVRLPGTAPNGFASGQLSVKLGEYEVDEKGWTQTVVRLPDGTLQHGAVQLIEEHGVSVISDLDDTIKQSDVTDKKALLANTFLKPFVAVEGMSELYQGWDQEGVAFHYLSASPWQLYPAIEAFTRTEQFPRGTFSMKHFRLKDHTFLNLFQDPEKYKGPIIRQFLARYPQRKFVLVGDSGEADLEIYAAVARENPAQVKHIFVRELPAAPISSERRSAMSDLPDGLLQIFKTPADLPRSIADPQ